MNSPTLGPVSPFTPDPAALQQVSDLTDDTIANIVGIHQNAATAISTRLDAGIDAAGEVADATSGAIARRIDLASLQPAQAVNDVAGAVGTRHDTAATEAAIQGNLLANGRSPYDPPTTAPVSPGVAQQRQICHTDPDTGQEICVHPPVGGGPPVPPVCPPGYLFYGGQCVPINPPPPPPGGGPPVIPPSPCPPVTVNVQCPPAIITVILQNLLNLNVQLNNILNISVGQSQQQRQLQQQIQSQLQQQIQSQSQSNIQTVTVTPTLPGPPENVEPAVEWDDFFTARFREANEAWDIDNETYLPGDIKQYYFLPDLDTQRQRLLPTIKSQITDAPIPEPPG